MIIDLGLPKLFAEWKCCLVPEFSPVSFDFFQGPQSLTVLCKGIVVQLSTGFHSVEVIRADRQIRPELRKNVLSGTDHETAELGIHHKVKLCSMSEYSF